MGKENVLETWKGKTEKTDEELSKMYDEIYEKAVEKYDPRLVDQIVSSQFGKKMRSIAFGRQVDDFFGIILGTDSARDIFEAMRQKCLREYRNDPMEAQLQGFVDESGTPLDYRENIFGRQKNPNFHKPLTGHAWIRNVFGLGVTNDHTKPFLWRLSLRQRAAKEFNYSAFTPIRFKAFYRDDSKGYVQLALSKQTAFKVTKVDPVDVESWIRKNFKVYTMDQLDQAYDNTKDASDPWVFLEAYIDNIDTNVNPKTRSRSIVLADNNKTSETVRAFIDETFVLDFGEYSKVLAFGKLRKWRRKDDDEDRTSMEAYSIFALPGQALELEEPDLNNISWTEDEEEGFIVPFVDEEEI